VGLIDYHAGVKLARTDPPFYGLLVALMLRADSFNAARLRAAFPDDWDEVQARYNAAGGVLTDHEAELFERMVDA
jgi:hypothetical protein